MHFESDVKMRLVNTDLHLVKAMLVNERTATEDDTQRECAIGEREIGILRNTHHGCGVRGVS